MNCKKIFIATIISLFTVHYPLSTTCADVGFGDKGEEVEEVQRLLIAKNYLSGEVDGDFGDATLQALKQFQADNNLDADGICGAETLKLLRGETSTSEILSAEIKLGDSGEQVNLRIWKARQTAFLAQ